MISDGYAWIITDVLTSLLDSVDTSVIESSIHRANLTGDADQKGDAARDESLASKVEEEIRQEYPDIDIVEFNVFGLWAYDGITSLAKAVEKVVGTAIPKFKKTYNREYLTDLDALGTSELGSLLLHSMQNTALKTGLSGDFRIVDGELQPSPYRIVNIIGKAEKNIGF
ncbi:hypothetical protein H5410_033250 [Solanum commersonii]|uniref:Receptor ligand binding region domain-containing protein n=1 Tax=Solanum commersonii TaxID=4109 RepID=A0A9J5YQ86_SOLCO|nr:hypothetical protein H5410_033250 [Solanum commersonii]